MITSKTYSSSFLKEDLFQRYSPILRVSVCIFLLRDVIVMREYFDVFYSVNSFVSKAKSPFLNLIGIDTEIILQQFSIFYIFYIFIIILFAFGIGKWLTPLLLFVCLDIVQALSWVTLNGGDNLVKFLVLYLIFIDSYSTLSLFPSSSSYKTKIIVSNLGGFSVCLHICLIYFLSAIHKIHSDVWFNGIATYYVLGSERFQGTTYNQQLVQNGLFVTFTTYGTILLELLFSILIWFKQTKMYFLLSMAVLHTFIGVFMMLYDFQFLFIMSLGMFLNNSECVSIWSKIKESLLRIHNLTKKPFAS